MKITPKEKEVMELLRNITHENIERINNILLGLMIYSLLNYADNEPITIPYFGTFLIRNKGDALTPEGKESLLETFFTPSDYLKENIGSYEDFKKSKSSDISLIPIMHYFENINERVLTTTLNDTFERKDDGN